MKERNPALAWRTVAAIAACVAALFGALSFTGAWRSLELEGFDGMSRATAPRASTVPITIVGIDEPSLGQLGHQWPGRGRTTRS